MELVDRYLHAVRGFLPNRDQDDIIRELADDIQSQLDDRVAELGRPLTEADIGAFLQQLGHPMLLAARFRTDRHVIGPAMFPFYWRTLTIALGVALLVNIVIAAVLVATGRSSNEVLQTIVRFPFTVGVTVFGWVTIVFAVAEWVLGRTKVLVGWNPTTLAPVPKDMSRVSRITVLLEFLGGASFLAWLLLVPFHQWLLFGPAALFLSTGPTLYRFYPAILVLTSVSTVVPLLNLFRPDWTRLRAMSRLTTGLIGLILMSLMIDEGQFVALKNGAAVEQYRDALTAVNSGARIFLAVTWLISAIDLAREVLRFWRARRQLLSRA